MLCLLCLCFVVLVRVVVFDVGEACVWLVFSWLFIVMMLVVRYVVRYSLMCCLSVVLVCCMVCANVWLVVCGVIVLFSCGC